MDPTTQGIIETIGDAGYSVIISADGEGRRIIDATDNRTGEYLVRGNDLYTVARELAGQVRIQVKER